MIAACHLCGGLFLSRTIAAINPRTKQIQPKVLSVSDVLILEAVGLFVMPPR